MKADATNQEEKTHTRQRQQKTVTRMSFGKVNLSVEFRFGFHVHNFGMQCVIDVPLQFTRPPFYLSNNFFVCI